MSKQEIKGDRSWYAIHTYAGYENAVARNLKQRIESLGMQDKIFNVVVPMEKKIKIKGGKRVELEEKVYPGYVLVDMIGRRLMVRRAKHSSCYRIRWSRREPSSSRSKRSCFTLQDNG